jgi:hypothetical protein
VDGSGLGGVPVGGRGREELALAPVRGAKGGWVVPVVGLWGFGGWDAEGVVGADEALAEDQEEPGEVAVGGAHEDEAGEDERDQEAEKEGGFEADAEGGDLLVGPAGAGDAVFELAIGVEGDRAAEDERREPEDQMQPEGEAVANVVQREGRKEQEGAGHQERAGGVEHDHL